MYKYINKPERKKIRLGLILFSFITALFYLLYIKAFWAYRYLPDVLRIGPRVITDLIALTYILFARLGIILPMAFLGIFLIYFYRNKKIDYKLNFLVITFLVFIPFLRNSMYFYQCISVIFVILSIVALDIIIEKYKTHSKLIIACFYIIIIMFSMFTIYVRINGSNYMKTSLYETAEYINQDISSYEAIGGVDVRKIRTVLTSPTIDKLGADYYIVDRIDLETEKELKDFPTTPSELASFIKYPFKEIKIIESSGENIFDVEFNLNNIEEDQNKIYANDDYMVIKK